MLLAEGEHRRSLLVRAIRIHLHLQLRRLQLVHRHQLLHVDFLDVGVRFVRLRGLLRRCLTALTRFREGAWRAILVLVKQVPVHLLHLLVGVEVDAVDSRLRREGLAVLV